MSESQNQVSITSTSEEAKSTYQFALEADKPLFPLHQLPKKLKVSNGSEEPKVLVFPLHQLPKKLKVMVFGFSCQNLFCFHYINFRRS